MSQEMPDEDQSNKPWTDKRTWGVYR